MPALDRGLWTQETGNPGGLRRPRDHVHTRRAGPPEPGLAARAQHEAGGGLSAAFCMPAWGEEPPGPCRGPRHTRRVLQSQTAPSERVSHDASQAYVTRKQT